jgi:hypothetical protein
MICELVVCVLEDKLLKLNYLFCRGRVVARISPVVGLAVPLPRLDLNCADLSVFVCLFELV